MTADIDIDARWVGRRGVGTATTMTLEALRILQESDEVPGKVRVSGNPEALAGLVHPAWEVRPDRSDPHRFLGQRGFANRSKRLELCFHQVRPLSRRARVQWIQDTIPLHRPASLGRQARHAYLRRVAATSRVIIVPSRHSAATVIDDLRVERERIRVVPYPVDPRLQAEVARCRSGDPVWRLVYIGSFAAHKNLERLVHAFGRSESARAGALLHLVGGEPDSTAHLQHTVSALPHNVSIIVEGTVPRDRIVGLLANSHALVMASLEEGFGLPAWEARCVGLPVIASDAASLREVVEDAEFRFDPYDLDAIAAAIDKVLSGPALVEQMPAEPSLQTYGRQVLAAIASAR